MLLETDVFLELVVESAVLAVTIASATEVLREATSVNEPLVTAVVTLFTPLVDSESALL